MRFVKVWLNSYLSTVNNNQQQCKSGAEVFQIPNLHKALLR